MEAKDFWNYYFKLASFKASVDSFARPHAYACCLDRHGEWWHVHPEALKEVNS
jgi:hypothetical protein